VEFPRHIYRKVGFAKMAVFNQGTTALGKEGISVGALPAFTLLLRELIFQVQQA
jgi:hypothetical protein